MGTAEAFDLGTGTGLEQLQRMRALPLRVQCLVAQRYDWNEHPETVLGWVLAQKGVDLASALNVFLNGEPVRYNYSSKRDVPEAHHGLCRLLDTIALRVNSGFYLPDRSADLRLFRVDRLQAWMRYQQEDAQAGRVGRWVFDEALVAPVLQMAAPAVPRGA